MAGKSILALKIGGYPDDMQESGSGIPSFCLYGRAGRVGLGRKASLADVPDLGEVNVPVFSCRFRDPSSVRTLASHGSSLLRGFRGGASRRGRPLRPLFNAQLRIGTDKGNLTV
ncbi:hypothetical protein G5I_04805 [Acromyrmex echinatior]|uniref:Uncharacterized protein n=1 Tax=Acromyrmex echinatior TaxID=103372 RepID=F4WGM2_ACREC|nr:hypothetical protein G5I_04805 [Acromyrmex echinatior]